uniref:Uncharacterized protein n=1 Tax=Sphondylothamnion multifidum TaxID=193186 RepID=A0A4D6X252_9FLOR|nr:hypothetical protein [Sphondylothamnion multifidum]
MNKKIKLKQKIHLLLISIEALDLYTSEEKFKNHDKLYYFHKDSDIINTINIIYASLIKTNIQKITLYLITQYNFKQSTHTFKQYIKKYVYIYYKCKKYYNTKSIIPSKTIERIAINNLYIINQVSKKYGIYFLLKYLHL